MIFLYYIVSIVVSWALLFVAFKLLNFNKRDIRDMEVIILVFMFVPCVNIVVPAVFLVSLGFATLLDNLESKSYSIGAFLSKIFSLK